MAAFEPLATYEPEQIALTLSSTKQEGPWIFGGETFALLAPVGDGDDEPHFPDRSAFFWPGEAPKRIAERGSRLFLFVQCAPDSFRFVGKARVTSYSSIVRPREVTFNFTPWLPRHTWLEFLGARLPRVPEGPPPEAELARLEPHSSPRDRWAALKAFLERWYSRPFAAMRDEMASGGVDMLRQLHEVVRAVPEALRHNRLVPSAEWESRDGRIVFLVENQGVCLWAFDPEGADPRVWYRINSEGEPWVEEPQPLTGFLIQAMLFEAVMHARFGALACALDDETANTIRARLQPLAMGRWNWGAARFLARDGALAMMMENEDAYDVWLAAPTPMALSPFEGLVTESWERVAF